VPGFVKERRRPEVGSIPDLLSMFEHELRFYVEIAPVLGVRVPDCYEASESSEGFRLVLEDLTSWRAGGHPLDVAVVLAEMHRRWEHEAEQRWPWLQRAGRAAAAIGELYDRVWETMSARGDLTPAVTAFASGLVGQVARLENNEGKSSRPTLIHGDASLRNVRSSPTGEIAFVDWEDVRSASGEVDLAWLLVSSVAPEQWDEVIDVYAPDRDEFIAALFAAGAQGVLALSDCEEDSAEARVWVQRLDAVALRLID
jgi:aminoglycoside phosphotransferase (APT) family kinase protein